MGIAFLAGLYALLFSRLGPEYAARWLPLPAIAVTYLFGIARRNLADNHRPGETQILDSLGWGNRLTLLRGVLVAGLLGFLTVPQPAGWLIWIPAALYTLADAADFFDGYVARITRHNTRLGEILDMSFDGVGVLAAALLAAQYGKVPLWYVSIGLARYLFVAGVGLRRKLNKPVYDLPPLLSRRVFAGLQMGFLAGVLWPVFTPPGTHIAALLFGIPILFGFVRDWFYITGALRPAAAGSRGRVESIYRWAAVGLRILVLQFNILVIADWLQNNFRMTPELTALGFLNLAAVLMLFLGILPRIAAIVALCALGFYQLFDPLTPLQITLAVIYTVILYQGSGALSAWTPEEYLFQGQAGRNKSIDVGQRA
jgi:CDP-diacylglycerol--glycerol-3-phosphate 3-phosphatidyltransferase